MDDRKVDILLVEDNPDHAELIIKELKGNIEIINNIFLVRDGQEALEYLFREGAYKDPSGSPRPSLILLDLKLPRVDGIEVLKRIRASEEYGCIPVVVLTTSTHEKDVISSYETGTDLYITKPVKYQTFIKAVGDLMFK